MELSSARFKALAVTAGFSLWFFIISSAINLFSIEAFAIFVLITASITQIFAIKLSKALNIFAIINTKIFLGILYIYGIFFKILRVDLLRLKKQSASYWLDIDKIKQSTNFRQY